MRPREGGNFGQRVVKDLLNAEGGWFLRGPRTTGWDGLWFPPTPHLPVIVEIKSSKDRDTHAGLSMEELVVRETAVGRGLGWALVRVVYRQEGQMRTSHHPNLRPVSVSLDPTSSLRPEVRNALAVSLARPWRPARAGLK